METVQATIQKELNGPGKLPGYQALNWKMRMQNEVQVPRYLVHKMSQNEDHEDPEGLEFHLHKRRIEK